METNMLCSEDEREEAVCACFCRFPLPLLCAEHLAKHAVSEESFHFPLPLYAFRLITSKEIKARCSSWLSNLRQAYILLCDTDKDLRRFEEQIEAAKLEVIQDFEQEVAEMKKQVSDLRLAFQAELQRAAQETSANALIEWSPESGSLSALIWNYDPAAPESLKPVQCWVERRSLSGALQVNVHSSLPSLQHFNQSGQSAELQRSDQQRECDQLRRCASELSAEVTELKRRLAIHEAKEGAAVGDSQAVPLQTLREKLAEVEAEQRTRTMELSKEIAALKSALDGVTAHFVEKGVSAKAVFNYEESCRALEEGWQTLQKWPSAAQQAVTIGLLLGEVLTHLARFSEAKSVVDFGLQVETRGEELLKLRVLSAALLFHQRKVGECYAACAEALRSARGRDAGTVSAAVFYATLALCDQGRTAEAAAVLGEWRYLRNETEFAELFELSARARLAFRQGSNQEAERLYIEAQRTAVAIAPTAFTTAINFFLLARVCAELKKPEEAKARHAQAHELLSAHFPGSIWTALNLSWLAKIYQQCSQRREAIAARLEAHAVFQAHFPVNLEAARNLRNLADLHRESGELEEAVAKRLEAQHILQEFPSAIDTAQNLADIAVVYTEMNRAEEAEQNFLQARGLFASNYPTSSEAAMNLYNLGMLYEKKGRVEAAIECANLALQIWAEGNSEKAQKLAQPLLDRLKNPRSTSWLQYFTG